MTIDPKKLRAYRKLAGLNQLGLANILTDQLKLKTRMPIATYSDKEINGRFSMKEINIICKALKIKPEDIMIEGVSDFKQVIAQLKEIQKLQLKILQAVRTKSRVKKRTTLK